METSAIERLETDTLRLQNLYSPRDRIWQDRALNLCNGAGDVTRTRNFQLGKLPTPRFIYNNLQNCATKCTLRSLQSLSRFPILHPLVGHWWDNLSDSMLAARATRVL